jgi:hypothetical protein
VGILGSSPSKLTKMSVPKVDSTIPDPKDEKIDTDVTVLGFGNDDSMTDRIDRAREDAKRQAEMPVKEALHKYRGAVLWSALMTLTIVMEGKSIFRYIPKIFNSF